MGVPTATVWAWILLESSFHQRIDLFWGIVKMSNGIIYLATLFRVALTSGRHHAVGNCVPCWHWFRRRTSQASRKGHSYPHSSVIHTGYGIDK
jgi:hypothetical protein